MTTFYTPTPDGIIGNEDCGQMYAWYVLNAVGLYQMTPGDNKYYIGRPMVDEANIKLSGCYFKVEVINNPVINKYVEKVFLNGSALSENVIDYKNIKEGNVLKIQMTSKKNL